MRARFSIYRDRTSRVPGGPSAAARWTGIARVRGGRAIVAESDGPPVHAARSDRGVALTAIRPGHVPQGDGAQVDAARIAATVTVVPAVEQLAARLDLI